MVLNHSCRAIPLGYHTLLNTSYIFTYNCWKYCWCNEFQSCRSKPVNGIITDRNYCMFVALEVLITKKKFEIKNTAYS